MCSSYKPCISVIVPVYNCEKYIYDCIVSVLNQSYKNFELIIVNDGSTDNSIKKIINLISGHKNISILNKENGGVSSARNLGLKSAKGDWIAFIDSDDKIETDYLKNLITGSYIDDEIDMVISGFKTFGYSDSLSNKFEDKIYNNETLGALFSKRLKSICLGTPWGKLYKRNIIDDNKILFDCKSKLPKLAY